LPSPMPVVLELGLANGESRRYRHITNLYLRPFQDLTDLARRRLAPLFAS
jgi:hypothetical protein